MALREIDTAGLAAAMVEWTDTEEGRAVVGRARPETRGGSRSLRGMEQGSSASTDDRRTAADT